MAFPKNVVNKCRASPWLIRRLVEEAERRALKNGTSIQVQNSVINASLNGIVMATEEVDGSFIALIGKSKEREVNQQQQPPPPICHTSTPSQVLPFATSPSTFKV